MSDLALYEMLKGCRFDPEAKGTYHVLAGGLFWGDELPPAECGFGARLRALTELQRVFGYRASLSLGTPRVELEKDWIELKELVPAWPGFREERIYGRVQRLLKVHKYKEAKCLRPENWNKMIDEIKNIEM